MRKRNVSVQFRLTEAEYAELKEKVKMSGMSRNAFLVHMIQEKTIYPVEKLSGLNEQMSIVIAQIRGMATNLNQMTKIANGRKEVPSMKYLESLASGMHQFLAILQPVWNNIREILYGDR